jgi:hypothetical protein
MQTTSKGIRPKEESMATAIIWTKGIGASFTIHNGHKVCRLSVGYVVQKLRGDGLPGEYVGGLYESLPAALAATRGVKMIAASTLTGGAMVVERRCVSGSSVPVDQVFSVGEVEHGRFTHYRLTETGEVRTVAPSVDIEVPV